MMITVRIVGQNLFGEKTMSDLIDRLKALDELKYEMKYGAVIDQCGLDTAYDIIKDLPSAELEERTAKVEAVEKPNVFKCGECGQYFHSTSWGSPVEYCSRCGSKLDWSGK